MFRHFEKDSIWFQDRVVQVNEELINHITGLPIASDKIDLKEEARPMGREGAKWAAKIIARRLIGVEASTYLSHLWVAVAVKAAEGMVYAWALWIADRFKEHSLASQMFGCPFLMPSLLVVICMDALGPLTWIKPNEQPQLNSYSCLKRRRGDCKDQGADAYLGKIYLMLWSLNDGPERSKKLPEYIKKQWREVQWMKDDQITYASLMLVNALDDKKSILLVVDHPLTSPVAQYYYWAVNKDHFSKEPYNMAWSPPDLLLIPFPEIREKGVMTGKEKEKKRRDLRARSIAPNRIGHFGHGSSSSCAPPKGEGTSDKAPQIPPKVQARLLQLEFEVVGFQGQIDEMQLKAEQKDQEVVEHIEEIQRLKVVPTQLIADVQRQLASTRDDVGGIREHMAHNIDWFLEGEKA
eukprot:Gb_05054 [translate_table: standard]